MIDALRAGYAAQQVNHTTQRAQQARQQTQQARTQDTVSLSGAGKLVSSFFAGLGVDYAPGKNISLDDIESALQQKQETLDRDITALFRKNGIETPPEVELTTDESGHVRVAGNHPQADRIEQLFADTPELENDFRRVSGMSSMVDAGHEYTEFSRAYEKNPYAAVARYADQLSGHMNAAEFSLTVGAPSTARAGQESAQEQPSEETGVADNAQADTSGQTTAPQRTATNTPPPVNFANATRQELFDWMNNEIRSGRMSLDESSPLMAMTMKVSVATGQPVSMESDTTRINFAEKARLGLEAANARNDQATAHQLQIAIDTMARYQSSWGTSARISNEADA